MDIIIRGVHASRCVIGIPERGGVRHGCWGKGRPRFIIVLHHQFVVRKDTAKMNKL